jgi:tRNA threonylcarbamoyladenosine biosynthesis protein TsaB
MSERVLILGIDTSADGDLALAELLDGGSAKLLAQQTLDPRRQSAELLPKLSLLLESSQASVNALSAIVTVNGPGSFTGLRIGISAAKGLAEAANIPVIAVSSLAVVGYSAKNGTVAVLQAGRSEYYVSIDGRESLESEADLPALLGDRPVVITDPKLAEKFPSLQATIGEAGAFAAILTVLSRFQAGDFDDTSTLDANYVRRPYTEANAEAKVAS